jgi:tryptophan-rich sensory protein
VRHQCLVGLAGGGYASLAPPCAGAVWSALYFKLQRPDWALFEVVFLWLSILALIMGLWRLSRWASLLLITYWVWVSIATVLNVQTVLLNGPFGAQI